MDFWKKGIHFHPVHKSRRYEPSSDKTVKQISYCSEHRECKCRGLRVPKPAKVIPSLYNQPFFCHNAHLFQFDRLSLPYNTRNRGLWRDCAHVNTFSISWWSCEAETCPGNKMSISSHFSFPSGRTVTHVVCCWWRDPAVCHLEALRLVCPQDECHCHRQCDTRWGDKWKTGGPDGSPLKSSHGNNQQE